MEATLIYLMRRSNVALANVISSCAPWRYVILLELLLKLLLLLPLSRDFLLCVMHALKMRLLHLIKVNR